MLVHQCFRVFASLVLNPSGVRKPGHVARLYDEVSKPPRLRKWSDKIALTSRPHAQGHPTTFVGRDRTLIDHLIQHNVRVIHDIFEARRTVFIGSGDHDHQPPTGSQLVRPERLDAPTRRAQPHGCME
jgi:hypothetical protein